MYLNLNFGKTMCDISTPDVSIVYTKEKDVWVRTVMDKKKCSVRDKNVVAVSRLSSSAAWTSFYSDVTKYAVGVTVSPEKLHEVFS